MEIHELAMVRMAPSNLWSTNINILSDIPTIREVLKFRVIA